MIFMSMFAKDRRVETYENKPPKIHQYYRLEALNYILYESFVFPQAVIIFYILFLNIHLYYVFFLMYYVSNK